jgi:hypothetical protein
MRFILVGLLFVHGALHFLGFRGRAQGVPWLVAGLGLVAAGVMLLGGRERWWVVAADARGGEPVAGGRACGNAGGGG